MFANLEITVTDNNFLQLNNPEIELVLIVDTDVHLGNSTPFFCLKKRFHSFLIVSYVGDGTMQYFIGNKRVVYVSLHRLATFHIPDAIY